VIGVILSGTRGDGSIGMAAIQAAGGATIVQDPAEALYPGITSRALNAVAADALLPSELVAQTIVSMIHGDDPPPGSNTDDPLLERIANQLEPRGKARSARSLLDKAQVAHDQARAVRQVLVRAASLSLAEAPHEAQSGTLDERQASGGGSA
jgi:CheB methylesterase